MRQLLRNMAELACNLFVLQSKDDPSDRNAVSGHLGRPRLSDGPAPTTLHYTTLHYTALHCTALHYTTHASLSSAGVCCTKESWTGVEYMPKRIRLDPPSLTCLHILSILVPPNYILGLG